MCVHAFSPSPQVTLTRPRSNQSVCFEPRSVALFAVSPLMSYYAYPAFGPILGSHVSTEGSSESVSALSLSLSDIISIPDEEPEQAQAIPAPGPHAPRANAMSLGFILSEQVSSGPFYGIQDSVTPALGSSSPPLPAKGSTGKREDTEGALIRGWAPLDPNHYTLVDDLEPPAVPVLASSGQVPSAEHKDARMVPGFSRTQGVHPNSTQSKPGSLTGDTHTQASTRHGRAIAMPFPAFHLPSAHSMHALAALASVRRGLDSSAAPRPVPASRTATTCHPVLSTQPTRAPRPAQAQRSASDPSPRIPPAPRGGVAPSLARSITNIRVARERALLAHTARPPQGVARGSEAAQYDSDEPAPSVLGKWVQ